MVLSIGGRIKGFLFRPSRTFDASKEDMIGDAFKYFVVILLSTVCSDLKRYRVWIRKIKQKGGEKNGIKNNW